MLNHLRRIHFYIVATSVALLTLTALLPQAKLDIAKEQLLALSRILEEVEITSYINNLVINLLDGGPSEHFNEFGGIRAFLGPEDLPEGVDLSEFEKTYHAILDYKFSLSTVDNDYIGENRGEYSSQDQELAQTNRILDLIDFLNTDRNAFLSNTPVRVQLRFNIWASRSEGTRETGCIRDELGGPVAGMFGEEFAETLAAMFGIQEPPYSSFRESWDIAHEIYYLPAEVVLNSNHNVTVIDRSSGKEIAAGVFTDPKIRIHGEEESEDGSEVNLSLQLCFLEDGQATFTNVLEGIDAPFELYLGAFETVRTSAIPELSSSAQYQVPIEPFEVSFSTLSDFAKEFGDFSLGEIGVVIDALAGTEAEAIEVAGIKISAPDVKVVGSLSLLILLFYFLVHIEQSKRRFDVEDAKNLPWLVLYEGLPARALEVMSLFVLPVFAVGYTLYFLVSGLKISSVEFSLSNMPTKKDFLQGAFLIIVSVGVIVVSAMVLRSLRELRMLTTQGLDEQRKLILPE